MASATLPAYLRQLFARAPTYDSLDAGLHAMRVAHPGGPIIQNVFRSPAGAPPWQRAYDLFGPEGLAGKVDGELLPGAPPSEQDLNAWLARDHLLWLVRDIVFVTRDVALLDSMAELLRREGLKDLQRQHKQQRAAVRRLCTEIEVLWHLALALYQVQPAGGARRGLYLHPHLDPLPEISLIAELCARRATLHLLLLCARHELGYLARKLEAQRTDKATPALDDWDWGLITARQGGWVQWKGDEKGRRQLPQTRSALGRLYGQLGQAAAKAEAAATELPRCRKILEDGQRCPNRVPPRQGGGAKRGGPPFKFCLKHTTSRRVRAAAEDVGVNNIE